MSAWAKPGVKCVCIGCPLGGIVAAWAPDPVVGAVYTIDRAEPSTGGFFAISLKEIRLVEPGTGEEFGYNVEAFRPLAFMPQSLEHDIALFNHIRTSDKERA